MLMRVVFDEDLSSRPYIALPSRSRLFYLEPLGMDTGYVESLTSYSARLAAAHNVTHASLFGREISPLIDRKHLRNSEARLDRGAILAASFRTLARAVNGTGVTARDYIRSLEQLTGRDDLCHLTMTNWVNVIPHRNLMKPSKAWCPYCYETFKRDGKPIYEPLLWSLSVITSCAIHHLRLRTRCPRCKRINTHLDSHSRPGFCSKCNNWLGQLSSEYCQPTEEIADDELEWQRWATEQLCILLAATTCTDNRPRQGTVAKSIRFCIQSIAGMTESRFARAVGVAQQTVNDWQSRVHTPELEKLLRISRFTQLPLLKILLGTTSHRHKANEGFGSTCNLQNANESTTRSQGRARIDSETLRIAIETALTAENTPSLQKVARSLNCSSSVLTKRFPVECKKLADKFKQWRKADWSKVEAELEKALITSPARSIRVIAKGLNRNHTNLYRYFPNLCRRIAQRFKLYRQSCRERNTVIFHQEIRDIVIALHLEGIYPSVKRVESRLHQRKTIRHSKMALDTLRQVREERAIPTAPNNFVRFAPT
jgi:transcriptional regulator with XRE-family HTH domain